MSWIPFVLAAASVFFEPVSSAPTTVQAAGAKQSKDQVVVCRLVNTTGSRIGGERSCKTKADWDRLQDETRDDVDRQRERATGVPLNIDPGTGAVVGGASPH